MNEKGFTLVELTVTTALLALASGLTLVTVESTLPEWRVRAGCSDLLGTLRQARLQAVTEGHPVAVVFEPTTGLFAAIPDPASTAWTPTPGSPLPRGRLSKGVTFVAPACTQCSPVLPTGSALRFDPSGRIRGAASPAYIHVGDPRRGVYRRLKVGFAGAVGVERWNGSSWK